MAGNKKIVLPVTKTGYQFQSDAELREVKWLISEGDFESLDEYGAVMQRMLKSLQEDEAAKNKRERRQLSILPKTRKTFRTHPEGF